MTNAALRFPSQYHVQPCPTSGFYLIPNQRERCFSLDLHYEFESIGAVWSGLTCGYFSGGLCKEVR